MVYCILYCVLYQDYDAMASNAAEHGGMKVLQDLRSLQRKLTGVKPLAVGLHSKRGSDEHKGSWLYIAHQEAERNQVVLPEGLLEVYINRELFATLDGHQYGFAAIVLSTQKAEADAIAQDTKSHLTSDVIGVWILPEDKRLPAQESQFIKFFSELLRPAGNLKNVKSFVKSCEKLDIRSAPLKNEFGDLVTMLEPMNEAVTTTELKQLRTKFENDSSLKLHKAVTLFPTGEELLDTVSSACKQRATDSNLVEDLGVLEKQHATLKEVTVLLALPTGKQMVALPQKAMWQQFHELLASVVAKSSSQFRGKRQTKFDLWCSAVEATRVVLMDAVLENIRAKETKVLQDASGLYGKINTGGKPTPEELNSFMTTVEQLHETIYQDPKSIGLDVLFKEQDDKLKEFRITILKFQSQIKLVGNTLTLIAKGPLNLVGDVAIEFSNLVGPATSPPHWDAFKVVGRKFLQKLILTAFTAPLKVGVVPKFIKAMVEWTDAKSFAPCDIIPDAGFDMEAYVATVTSIESKHTFHIDLMKDVEVVTSVKGPLRTALLFPSAMQAVHCAGKLFDWKYDQKLFSASDEMVVTALPGLKTHLKGLWGGLEKCKAVASSGPEHTYEGVRALYQCLSEFRLRNVGTCVQSCHKEMTDKKKALTNDMAPDTVVDAIKNLAEGELTPKVMDEIYAKVLDASSNAFCCRRTNIVLPPGSRAVL
jgi:hypothetical protein